MSKRIGIDVGGTFTDFVLLDRVSGALVHHKEPSTPADPCAAVGTGLAALMVRAEARPGEVELIVHGTTLSLNALLQRRGARVALVTSRGSKDILELARIRMAHSYDFFAAPEEPLVTRECVLEIDARVGADGELVSEPDEAALDAAVAALAGLDVDLVVLSIVNGYANAAFEQRIAQALRARCGTPPLVAATQIWAEAREYERTMIAVMNGYVAPLMQRYYDGLEALLRAQGFTSALSFTANNGGIIDLRTARARPIDTILSGPAAGVVAAANCALANAVERIVTFDMGGTSTDVAVIEHGAPDLTTNTMIGEIPLILPVVNVSAIGAGGGSIVRVDQQGMLKVGPLSAGADPGPACYGRGGTAPTITDCYLACGFLDAANFLGGRLPLSIERARAALAPLATVLGYDERADPSAEAGAAAIRVASSMMATEVRKLLARRGSDIRAFTLIPYGGAGAVHAALLAEEAGLSSVLVPRTPATFCALGAVVANLRRDFVRSCRLQLDGAQADSSALQGYLDTLMSDAREWSSTLDKRAESWRFAVAADLRYPGQAFELSVEIGDSVSHAAVDARMALRAGFEQKHRLLYGFIDETAPVEMTRLVVSAIGSQPGAESSRAEPDEHGPGRALENTRRIFSGSAWLDTPCLARDAMAAAEVRNGPLVIEQSDTTVLVPAGWQVTCQPSGDLFLTRSGA